MTARIPLALVTLCAASLVLAGVPSAAAAGPSTHVVIGSTIGGDNLLAVGPVVHKLAGAQPLPVVKATAWVLADLTTGEILAAHNAHMRLRPASTLKTLTSLTLLNFLDPKLQYKVLAIDTRADGSKVGVVANAKYTVNDLLHGLLLPSGNDAASSLAHAYGGFQKTVTAMNAEAVQLQALDTHAVNPSGLDADAQFSSAYDLALIARAALGVPVFRSITGTKSYAFPGKAAAAGAKRSTYRIYSQNRLLLHGFKGTFAGKTGFTTKAGRTFWAAATRNGHSLVVTLMQIGESSETAAKALLTWGFRNEPHVAPVGQLVNPVLPESANATTISTNSRSGVNASSLSAFDQISGENGMPLALSLLAASVVGVAMLYRRRRPKEPTSEQPSAVTTIGK